MDLERMKARALVSKGLSHIASINRAGGPRFEDAQRFLDASSKIHALAAALDTEGSGELGFLPLIWLVGLAAAAAFAIPILYRIQQNAEETIDTGTTVVKAALWGTALFLGYKMFTTGRLPFTQRTI